MRSQRSFRPSHTKQKAAPVSNSNKKATPVSHSYHKSKITNPNFEESKVPRQALQTSIKIQFLKILTTAHNKCPQNGSKKNSISKSDPWENHRRSLRGFYPSRTLIKMLRPSHTLINKYKSQTQTLTPDPPHPNPPPDPRVSGAVQALAHPHPLGARPGEIHQLSAIHFSRSKWPLVTP